jgi:hypothetical protein
MSDTPRTDALPRIRQAGATGYVPIDYCRQLERELAAAKQIMGELCESCGWAMRLPDQPCRCELERDLAEARDHLEANYKGCELLERMVYEAREQRDALINILTDVINDDGTPRSIDRASIFLTAVKGGSG